jgi:DNA-binding XRE family transcriptional regulator
MTYKVSCSLPQLRKQWALTQEELGRLLGEVAHQQVSSLELEKAEPSIGVLFGLEIIFGLHAKAVFVKWWDEIEEEVVRNLYRFQQEIENDSSAAADRKRQLLGEALSRAVLQAKQIEGYGV